MNLDDYQFLSLEFAVYPEETALEYTTLGLVGEAGEVANKIKKISRDRLSKYDVRQDIADELGDVLWYMAALATELELDLAVIARNNLKKLADRKARNVIGGSGDNR